MKFFYILLAALTMSGAGVLLWQETGKDKQRTKSENIVRDFHQSLIDRAKLDSKKEVRLPAAEGMPTPPYSIDDVINKFSLLHVMVKDKETIVEPYSFFYTWYKLEVLETLCRQELIGDTTQLDDIPSRFLPLLDSESLLKGRGGSIMVDGIRVIQGINQNEFWLEPGREYIIAANLENGGKLISPINMSSGVFQVENSNLKPLGRKNNKFVQAVESMMNNDLNRFRSEIQARQKRPKIDK